MAKKVFHDTPETAKVYRGESTKPLYVSVVGLSLSQAKDCVISMGGKHRLPKVLKQVDQ